MTTVESKSIDNRTNVLFMAPSRKEKLVETDYRDLCDHCGSSKNSKTSGSNTIHHRDLQSPCKTRDERSDSPSNELRTAPCLATPESGESLSPSNRKSPDLIELFTASSLRVNSAGSTSSGAQQSNTDDAASDSTNGGSVERVGRKKSVTNQIGEVLSNTSKGVERFRGRIRRKVGKKKIQHSSGYDPNDDQSKKLNYPRQTLPECYEPYPNLNERENHGESVLNTTNTSTLVINVISCEDNDTDSDS